MKSKEQFRPAVEVGLGVKVRLMLVEPAAAAEWLGKNRDNNRPVSRSRVRQYAADMRRGKWLLSNDMVAFDCAGRLVNGQHRLHACVAAGAGFLTLVAWNLPDESMLSLDSGRKRSTDDNMGVAGREYAKGVGATVRRIFAGARHGGGADTRPYSDVEIDEFLAVHARPVALAHEILGRGQFKAAPLRAVVARAAICLKPEPRLREFAGVLSTGLMKEGDEAAVLLRNHVMESCLGGSSARKDLYGRAESALAAFLDRRPCKPLRAAKEELFPIPNEGYWDES